MIYNAGRKVLNIDKIINEIQKEISMGIEATDSNLSTIILTGTINGSVTAQVNKSILDSSPKSKKDKIIRRYIAERTAINNARIVSVNKKPTI